MFEGTLSRFNPERNDDLGGLVVDELQRFRIGDVVNTYKRQQAGSLDIQPGETGSIRTPVADEAVDVETTEAPRSELKQGLRVDGEQFVDQKLKEYAFDLNELFTIQLLLIFTLQFHWYTYLLIYTLM